MEAEPWLGVQGAPRLLGVLPAFGTMTPAQNVHPGPAEAAPQRSHKVPLPVWVHLLSGLGTSRGSVPLKKLPPPANWCGRPEPGLSRIFSSIFLVFLDSTFKRYCLVRVHLSLAHFTQYDHRLQMNLVIKQTQTHRCRKQTYGYQRGKGLKERKIRSLGLTHVHTTIHKITNENLLYSTGDNNQHLIITHKGKKPEKEYIHTYTHT